MSSSENLPMSVTIYGKELKQGGRGKYPYDCAARDKHPNAMIYFGDGCWADEFGNDFKNRDKTKDVYAQKPLKYVVKPSDIATFHLFNTQDNVVLGGAEFRTVDEAFTACDGWNNVPPGSSARSQQITKVSGGVARARRLMSVTAKLHEIGQSICEAISAKDDDTLKSRQEQYKTLAAEYIGLAAADLIERHQLAESVDKRLSAYDFKAQSGVDLQSIDSVQGSELMDDLERLAKMDFKLACALWDKHAPAAAQRPAIVDPEWKRQINELKAVTAAIDRAGAAAVNEIYVSGEDYRLTVSMQDGRIVHADCYSDVANQFVTSIDRFDIDEAREWVERYSGQECIAGHSFNVVAIGFWKKDGAFSPGEEDYRQEIELASGSRASMRP